MKGMKIKISNTGNINILLPYKNGLVGWELRWWGVSGYAYDWHITNCPDIYNPTRVKKAHSQFLRGVGMYRKLERAAAANHVWWLLERLREAHKRILNARKVEIEYNNRIMLEKGLVADCDG